MISKIGCLIELISSTFDLIINKTITDEIQA
jgi:hypothetical protein